MPTSPVDQTIGDPGTATRPVAPEPISQRLDTAGMSCPLPIVKTAQAMMGLEPGQLLEVIAYNPKAVTDFAAWSRSTGNAVVESSAEGNVYRFVLRKK